MAASGAVAGVTRIEAVERPGVPARTRLLLEGRVLPTLLRLAAPDLGEAAARVGFIAADGWFVSWLGEDALAGVSLVFPLFIVTQMISAGGVGVGVSAAVARALGAGRRGEAEALAWQAVWLAVAAAALVGVGMLAGGPALYRAFGAHGGALTAAISYSNLVFAGGIAVWLMNLLANVVRGTGHMAVAAGAIIAGEAVHLVASPVLILGLGPFPALGVAGAGVAVLASYTTGAAVLALYLGAGRGAVRLVRAAMAPRLDLWGMVLRIGAFAGLTMLMTQAITVVVTSMVAGFGSAALAGYGAAQRLELLQTPITFGLRLGGDCHDRGQSRRRSGGQGAGRRAGERADRGGDRAAVRRRRAAAAARLDGAVRHRSGGGGGRPAVSAHGRLDPAAAGRRLRAGLRADGRRTGRAAGDGDRAEARDGAGRRLVRDRGTGRRDGRAVGRSWPGRRCCSALPWHWEMGGCSAGRRREAAGSAPPQRGQPEQRPAGHQQHPARRRDGGRQAARRRGPARRPRRRTPSSPSANAAPAAWARAPPRPAVHTPHSTRARACQSCIRTPLCTISSATGSTRPGRPWVA